MLLTLSLFLFGSNAEAQLGKLLDKAKESSQSIKKMVNGEEDNLDISGGLKAALNEGVSSAVSSLSAKDGYLASPYKVIIPEDARQIISKLKRVPGFRNVEDELITKMNAAAELAAKKATPIFVDAIKSMTIRDAKNILLGDSDAATRYLESNSRSSLYKLFLPVIQQALQEVDATKYWNSVVTKYNALPLTKDINPDLDDHVNNSALDGLFGLIQTKELGIREDVNQRTSPLLMQVFGELDK